MAANEVGLPLGFQLDAAVAPAAVPGLPAGFTLDQPAVAPKAPPSGNMLTDIPHEIYQAGASGLHDVNAINPWGAERAAAQARGEPPSMTAVPRAVGGALATIGAPITGVGRSVLGHTLDLINQGMRAGAVKLYGEERVRQAEAATGYPAGGGDYETAKADADKLMMGLGPKGGMRPVPTAIPPPPLPGPLGVTLSQGQATQALPAIQREQSALTGRLGPTAQDVAKQFQTQQEGQLGAATENVRQSLDPFGQVVAGSPQEAGQVVSQSLQTAAAQRKAAVDAAYKSARSLPGEVHADAFKDIGTQIKQDLSNRSEPVVIDDALTPFASKAIQDVDNRIAQLQIQNRASPYGQPAQPSIMGITLDGVDQMRRRLSTFRRQAFGSGNATDGHAVKAVLDAFDNHIDNAVNSGMFSGDQRAVQAWNNARAAHADYSATFKGGPNDPVGRIVKKMIGDRVNDPMIPEKVADQLYGAGGTSATNTSVPVANRIKSIMGDASPEWSAVKQGLFSRITETPPGVTDWGPQKISNNINKFLNSNKSLAEAVFTSADRNLLQKYANLHSQLIVPPGGANYSQTSTFVNPVLNAIKSQIGNAIGFVVGGAAGHALGIPYAGEAAGVGVALAKKSLANAKQAKQISAQMPLVANALKHYQKQLNAVQKANSPASQRTLALATGNLANTLRPLGINLGQVQGAVPAGAGQQNQNQQ